MHCGANVCKSVDVCVSCSHWRTDFSTGSAKGAEETLSDPERCY